VPIAQSIAFRRESTSALPDYRTLGAARNRLGWEPAYQAFV
jgi:hypothetical protein